MELKVGDWLVYSRARKLGVLDEVCEAAGYETLRKKWTKEEAKSEAEKYKTRGDLKKENPACYRKIRESWPELLPPEKKIKWTREVVSDLISNYTNLKDFRESHPHAYASLLEKGWHDLTDHLEKGKPQRTFEDCLSDAQECKDKGISYKGTYGASYRWACDKGWLSEIRKKLN
jgi:hypothetical protein